MALLLRMLGEGDKASPRAKSAALWSFHLNAQKDISMPLNLLPASLYVRIHQRFASVSHVVMRQQTATTKQTDLQSGPRPVPWHTLHPPTPRSWGLPRGWPITHWRSWRLYTSPRGRCLRGNGPSRSSPTHAASLPLLSCSGKVWLWIRRGPIYHLEKPPLWRLCVISGPVNGESAGMHTEQRYHRCGAEEHPGRNLIFVFLFLFLSSHLQHDMHHLNACRVWNGQAGDHAASKNKRSVEIAGR